jgi:hypothetical protein
MVVLTHHSDDQSPTAGMARAQRPATSIRRPGSPTRRAQRPDGWHVVAADMRSCPSEMLRLHRGPTVPIRSPGRRAHSGRVIVADGRPSGYVANVSVHCRRGPHRHRVVARDFSAAAGGVASAAAWWLVAAQNCHTPWLLSTRAPDSASGTTRTEASWRSTRRSPRRPLLGRRASI